MRVEHKSPDAYRMNDHIYVLLRDIVGLVFNKLVMHSKVYSEFARTSLDEW